MLNFFLGCLGAAYPELARLHRALTDEKRVTFPRAYFIVEPLFIGASGALNFAFPSGTSPFLALYIGAAGPKVFSQILKSAEPLLPGALTGTQSGQLKPGGPGSVATDDTSVPVEMTTPVYQVSKRRFRRRDGLYRYLTLV